MKVTRKNCQDVKFDNLDAIAAFFGVSKPAITEWGSKGAPHSTGDMSLTSTVLWRISTLKGEISAYRQKATGPSPALEEYRVHKARNAELDVLEREADLVSKREMIEGLAEAAHIIKAAGDTMQRKYGRECRDILIEAVEDAEKAIDRLCDAYQSPEEVDA